MTTPNGPIKFNSATGGSDTAASGLGPETALTGAGASTTASSAVVAGISTTGVSAGDLLFVQSSSGRQFSVIASVDSPTQVTCDDTFANTESGRNWAIGGKRATFDDASSRRIFGEDSFFMCRVQTETDQALTSPLGFNGAVTRVEATGPDQKLLTISGAGNAMFRGGFFRMQNFKLQALDSNELLYSDNSDSDIGITTLKCQACTVGDPTNSFSTVNSSPSSSRVSFLAGTVVQNISDANNRLHTQDRLSITELDGTLVRDCGQIRLFGNRDSIRSTYCIFVGTGSNSLVSQRYLSWVSYGSIYYNWANALTGSHLTVIAVGCLFHTIQNPTNRSGFQTHIINSFQFNRTGTLFSATAPIPNELTTLSDDPCLDAANLDFNMSDSSAPELASNRSL